MKKLLIIPLLFSLTACSMISENMDRKKYAYNSKVSKANAQKIIQDINKGVKKIEGGDERWRMINTVKLSGFSDKSCTSLAVSERWANSNFSGASLEDLHNAIRKEYGIHRYHYAEVAVGETWYAKRGFNGDYIIGDGTLILRMQLTRSRPYVKCGGGNSYKEWFYYSARLVRNGSNRFSLARMKSPLTLNDRKQFVRTSKFFDKEIALFARGMRKQDGKEANENARRSAYRTEQKQRRRANERQHMQELRAKIYKNMSGFQVKSDYIDHAKTIRQRSAVDSQYNSGRSLPPVVINNAHDAMFYETILKNQEAARASVTTGNKSAGATLDCSTVIRNGSGEFNIGPKLSACGGGGKKSDSCRQSVGSAQYKFLLSYVAKKGRTDCKSRVKNPSNTKRSTGATMDK